MVKASLRIVRDDCRALLGDSRTDTGFASLKTLAREVFGQGNEFCQKITFVPTLDEPTSCRQTRIDSAPGFLFRSFGHLRR